MIDDVVLHAGSAKDEAISSLFIFGSFSEGMVHFNKIKSAVTSMVPASVRGAIYRMPSGMLVLTDDGSHVVSGWVVTLASQDLMLALLDTFHGVNHADPTKGLFHRLGLEAVLDDGASVNTQAYCINLEKMPRTAKVVEGADWQKSMTEAPPLFDKLTERQRTYIQKLGASSGRDIVPIDLTLYRELMRLEVVVDKGRRLALSPLGQELFRMLS